MPADLALIFDMDGVLIDSMPAHREAWVQFNSRYNRATDEAMLERMCGKRNDEIIRDYYGRDLPEREVHARGAAKEALWREMVGPRLDRCLVSGVREFLDRHKHRPIGLATNAEPANVNFLLDRSGLRPYFQAVVDGQQVERPKPSPEIYLKTADLLGVAPPRCVVFEDSHGGVAAAQAAGMRVVGIRTTHREFKEIDLTVDDFLNPELDSWLERHARI